MNTLEFYYKEESNDMMLGGQKDFYKCGNQFAKFVEINNYELWLKPTVHTSLKKKFMVVDAESGKFKNMELGAYLNETWYLIYSSELQDFQNLDYICDYFKFLAEELPYGDEEAWNFIEYHKHDLMNLGLFFEVCELFNEIFNAEVENEYPEYSKIGRMINVKDHIRLDRKRYKEQKRNAKIKIAEWQFVEDED